MRTHTLEHSEQGYSAFLEGVPGENNPYPAGSWQAVDWADGWLLGLTDVFEPIGEYARAIADAEAERIANLGSVPYEAVAEPKSLLSKLTFGILK